MRFQVLSHAGLSVTGAGVNLLCDPWVVGSTYWRSWWNYPPVSRELVESLKPDFIYLTHIHWDHFQGPSLRKFPKTTQIYVPKGNFSRIKRDLTRMGFKNVHELKHGETAELAPGFKITSYQFNVFLDSAVVIECEGITLFNANDAKFMGPPFKQILKRHPKVDFVLRSHSSANSRACYEIADDPTVEVDDNLHYIQEFSYFVRSTGAKYAIPFASNMCHLHKDVYHFNDIVQTPQMVADYFAEQGIESPTVQPMVSGDYWDSEEGFKLTDIDYFGERERHLEEYRQAKAEILEKFYERETKANVRLSDMETYFNKLFKVIPFFMRRYFKGHPVTYVLTAGDRQSVFEVDVYNKTVKEMDSYDDERNPIQVHTSAYIMRQCLKMDLFSHMSIGKRVKYRVTTKTKKYIERLNTIFNLYEYDMLPLRRVFQPRSIETWLLRWREVVLYFLLLKNLILTKRLNTDKYMQLSRRRAPVANLSAGTN